MSLTFEAHRERKWGLFPVLRAALEDKEIPGKYYGFTSAPENIFECMDRLIHIAVLASEYENDIRQVAASKGREEMYRDLRYLEDGLNEFSDYFKKMSDRVRMLYSSL
jgi:hypothetical protein